VQGNPQVKERVGVCKEMEKKEEIEKECD